MSKHFQLLIDTSYSSSKPFDTPKTTRTVLEDTRDGQTGLRAIRAMGNSVGSRKHTATMMTKLDTSSTSHHGLIYLFELVEDALSRAVEQEQLHHAVCLGDLYLLHPKVYPDSLTEPDVLSPPIRNNCSVASEGGEEGFCCSSINPPQNAKNHTYIGWAGYSRNYRSEQANYA